MVFIFGEIVLSDSLCNIFSVLQTDLAMSGFSHIENCVMASLEAMFRTRTHRKVLSHVSLFVSLPIHPPLQVDVQVYIAGLRKALPALHSIL